MISSAVAPGRRGCASGERVKVWLAVCLLFCLGRWALGGQESWAAALSQMPLGTNVTQLDRLNCVPLLLGAFGSNQVVKALVFMPGATDEFYMFRRAKARLTQAAPTLLDAVSALTNQTLIRATFQAPFLLLHSDEDPLDLEIQIEHQPTVDKLKATPFRSRVLYFDQDWESIQPILKKTLKLDVRPWRYSEDSWHFYRHSLAAWNLTCWEALQAVAFAGKTGFSVRRPINLLVPQRQVVFFGDVRFRAKPTLTEWPK
ncbi:MAG: hypothetical protein ABSF95_19545 [Verrucomicrobiota bacterium]